MSVEGNPGKGERERQREGEREGEEREREGGEEREIVNSLLIHSCMLILSHKLYL